MTFQVGDRVQIEIRNVRTDSGREAPRWDCDDDMDDADIMHTDRWIDGVIVSVPYRSSGRYLVKFDVPYTDYESWTIVGHAIRLHPHNVPVVESTPVEHVVFYPSDVISVEMVEPNGYTVPRYSGGRDNLTSDAPSRGRQDVTVFQTTAGSFDVRSASGGSYAMRYALHDAKLVTRTAEILTAPFKPRVGTYVDIQLVNMSGTEYPRWYNNQDQTVVGGASLAGSISTRVVSRHETYFKVKINDTLFAFQYTNIIGPGFPRPASRPATFWCSYAAHRSTTKALHRPASGHLKGWYVGQTDRMMPLRAMCDECWVGYHESLKEQRKVNRNADRMHDYHANNSLARGFMAHETEIEPTRFFGVELEIDANIDTYRDDDEEYDEDNEDEREHAKTLKEVWGNICNRMPYSQAAIDSSVKNGFEIISSPMTLRFARDYWMKDKGLVPLDVNKTCGMHVHVNRSSLTELTICKLQTFLADVGNAALIEKFAGRGTNEYCKRPRKARFTAVDTDRYAALNVSNANTVEFRLFAGTAHNHRVVANLEFCEALISFCEATAIGNLKAEGFKAWVVANKRLYKQLWLVSGWAFSSASPAPSLMVARLSR